MKKIVLVALLFFGIHQMANARIVEIHMSRGFFGHYGDITQTYMGLINGEQWWILNCHSWGVKKCRLRPTAGKVGRDLEIEQIENAKLDNLMVSIETEDIADGTLSGQTTRHYQAVLEDSSVVDIYISITWTINANNPDVIIFNANVINMG